MSVDALEIFTFFFFFCVIVFLFFRNVYWRFLLEYRGLTLLRSHNPSYFGRCLGISESGALSVLRDGATVPEDLWSGDVSIRPT